MIKKVVILPDVHLDTNVPKEYRVVKNFIKDLKPDQVLLLGDFMDVSALSAWDMDKKRKMEGRRFQKEVDVANKELDFLQANSKEVIFIAGNHEYRIDRYIDKHPELEGMMEVPIVLNLEKRKIKYIPYNKIFKLGKCNFVHGLFTNQYHASKHLEAIGDNIVYGHTHRPMTWFKSSKLQKPIMAYGLGCLCNKEPEYMQDKWANWLTQFSVMYYDTKTGKFNLYPINIIDNKFIWDGVEYK
jgi:predicted phosphodiesterase